LFAGFKGFVNAISSILVNKTGYGIEIAQVEKRIIFIEIYKIRHSFSAKRFDFLA
jgi:hypothetical protein